MKTAIRTYHPVPALQRTSGNMQDAPRIKHILKTSLLEDEAKNPPSTPPDILAQCVRATPTFPPIVVAACHSDLMLMHATEDRAAAFHERHKPRLRACAPHRGA